MIRRVITFTALPIGSFNRPSVQKERGRETTYEDKGCIIHHSCLSCPLPTCIEERVDLRSRLRRKRETTLLQLAEQTRNTN